VERFVAIEERPLGDLTVPAILAQRASEQPNAIAFVESRSTQTYRGVEYDVDAIGVALRRAGIGRRTHVAIMMPPGADLATAVLSVTCHAIAVPLDSKLVIAEVDHVLARLRIQAIIVDESAAARAFCEKRGFRDAAALGGIGFLMCSHHGHDGDLPAEAELDSIAVVLRTSGTTAEPKLVAISHRNLTARADRGRRSLALTRDDRALCIAPVYYGQGLDAGLFFPILTGGSVAYPPLPRQAGPDESLTWFAEFHPTWFGTSPTTLLNMLERSRARPGLLLPRQLRFIQVGGAPMGDESRIAVEEAFGAPVLENYGSTEGGQMANNVFGVPLRGSGTFGVPDAFSIGTCDENGLLLAPGASGEIVARGPTVTPGCYDENGVLHSVLIDGWFRTGDVGFVDVDGFLTVSGRIKDIINRGGEKISPAEIDHILTGHPDVLEAAAFAVPHARLGEDVAAAVVLRRGSRVTGLGLRRYVAERVAPFKVPRRIHIVDELPKGLTGKISRSALAQRLTPPVEPGPDGPRTTLEIEIVSLWERLLGIQSIDPMADFFQLGGDSLLAVQMLMELEIVVGHDLSESLLFEAATPRQLASAITAEAQERRALLVPLRTTGPKRPFLFFDGDLAGGGYYARRLAEFVEDRPIWLLRPFEAEDGKVPTIETMATRYLSLLREAGVSEPFLFGGHCNGALLAMETARQAESAGDHVDVVVMIEAVSVNARRSLRFAVRLFDACLRLGVHDRALRERILRRALNELWDVARSLRRIILRIRGSSGNAQSGDFDLENSVPAVWNKDEELDRAYNLRMSAFKEAVAAFLPAPLRADLVAFKAEQTRRRFHSISPWRGFGSTFRHTVVKGSHLGCITTEIDGLGSNLREILEQYG
jgi:acyl-CoA synthetase (AMP-forming)/AMP-acid ligase II/thioesterase domain-containing protein/acyl carrier protein